MRFKNRFVLLFVYTFIFSFLIFIAKNYFFGGKQEIINNHIEKNYIEPVSLIDEYNEKEEKNKYNEIIYETLTSAKKIKYTYNPDYFSKESEVFSYKDSLNSFLLSDYIFPKIAFLEVVLNKQRGEVRGKMKNSKVRIFGLYDMSIKEFLAVSIHEFSHFYDLYILEKKVIKDTSEYFYDISWLNTNTIKKTISESDFVSGYAMTNKYEDFAESYTYYVLHNSDFYSKALESKILMDKYNFFRNFVFINEEFITNKFRVEEKIKDYYRDITKIDFSLEKFLQYLKK